MKKSVIFLCVFFCINNIVAQTILPDKSAVIDTIKRAQCQQIVDEINTMQLYCDTVVFKAEYGFTGIYFDEKGLLRKYFRKIAWESERSTMFVYYNENGELVYLFLDTDSNCGDGKEFYYLNKGRIVDFAGNVNCGCCEEDLTQEEINHLRPVIGNQLKTSMNWELNLTNFIHAKTLLKILQNENYYENEEF